MSISKKDKPYNSTLKGVAALLSDNFNEDSNNSNHQQSVDIEAIKLPPSQPRRYFDEEKLESLANSIKQEGLLEPIVVRSLDNSQYELIAGERRLKASKLAGLTTIAIVIIDCDSKKAQKLRLIENLQREDLNAYEETVSILELIAEELNIDQDMVLFQFNKMRYADEEKDEAHRHNVMSEPENLAIQQIFSNLGKITWQSFIKNRLPLLKLPDDIQEVLAQGKLEYTKANAIARVKDLETRTKLLTQAIEQKWSLSEIRKAIESLLKEVPNRETKENPIKELTAQVSEVNSLLKKNKSILEDKKKLNQIKKTLQNLLDLVQFEEV